MAESLLLTSRSTPHVCACVCPETRGPGGPRVFVWLESRIEYITPPQILSNMLYVVEPLYTMWYFGAGERRGMDARSRDAARRRLFQRP